MSKLEELLGKTITAIDVSRGEDDDRIKFATSDGALYTMDHPRDCCETVEIAEIIGDLDDLIGSPVLLAEAVESENKTPEGIVLSTYDDSYTWTFYKLSTIKGSVTIRWLGSSNGCYSESVFFEKVSA